MYKKCWLPLLLLCILLPGCGGSSQNVVRTRVVILGFDGMDPILVERMMAAGELPNLSRLHQQGGYQHLGSTIPPQSPTAWSSFATCTQPGNHGIFDFLRRNVRSYTPTPGFGMTHPPELAPDGSVKTPARSLTFRQGETFWSVADKQGIRCKLLHIPFSYPPDALEHGEMLCGEGVPDIRGFTTTFYSLSDAFTPEQLEAQEKKRVAGGMRIPLRFDGDEVTVKIPGSPDPRLRTGVYVETPLRITVDRNGRTLSLEFQERQLTIVEKTWSPWVEWTFAVSPQFSVRAISSFYALEVGERVRLYMTSLQFHPKEPYIPFSCPETYSGELADRYGLYKTIGWSHDTHALRQDALTEDAFLEDAEKTDAWLEKLTLDELDRNEFRLLIAVWTSTDRIAHMFWRFRDPKHPLYTEDGAKKYGRSLEDSYRRADGTVGKIMDRLKPGDLLMVLSDHGFHSFRKGFNLNTWLIRNGYLALRGQTDPATAHTEEGQELLQGIDWSRSRAYGLGLGGVYLNLKGREGQGIVEPSQAQALIAELRERLLEVRDPDTAEKIFSAVYNRDEYQGRAAGEAPDLQLGYDEGYQTTKSSAKGAAPAELFEPNLDKWSGDHASSEVAATAGVLFANRPLASNATLMDLGVTALHYLGATVPKEYEGKNLLASGPSAK
ncbi:MAG: alkaline phosphatase family protein [Candidatus Hydrogenedentes bacterium]|nr:alkaline phosphatase family protein [Candidatus Hydrogenedentota bacterium]